MEFMHIFKIEYSCASAILVLLSGVSAARLHDDTITLLTQPAILSIIITNLL